MSGTLWESAPGHFTFNQMNYMKSKSLCRAALAGALAVAFSPGASAAAPVIHGNIVGPADWVDYTSGIYTFAAEAPVVLDMQKESRFISVNGGGDLVDGMYHYISDNDGLGSSYDFRMYLYDATTWIPKNNFRVPGNWSSPDMTYDRTTGRLYGSFTTDCSIWQFGWMNPADGVFTPLASAGGGYPVVAVNRFGAVYAIDFEGNLLEVNKADGSTAKLFSTGLIPSGLQSGCFDPQGDTLYWCFRGADDKTALYAVDIALGSAGVREIGAFPMNEIVTGAYIEPVAPDPSVTPAAVSGIKVVTADDESVVSFALPATYADGAPITAPSVDYMVLVDGIMPLQALSAAPGTEVECIYKDLADGEHMVTVMPGCDNHDGVSVTSFFFVGADTPMPVGDLRVNREGNMFTARWSAPAGGAGGGSINQDALTYEVKFFTGNKSETFTVGEPRFGKEVIIDYAANCRVEVVAVDGTLRSEAVESAPVMMGPGYPVPYSANFDGGAGVNDFLMVDANGDGATWFYEPIYDDVRTYYKTDTGNMDDWLYTPIIDLNDGYFYHLQFSAKTAGVAYEELMEVKAGLMRTAGDMTLGILPVKTYVGTSATVHDAYFTIPASGNWHIGFHSVTEGTSLYLSLDNIKVERGGLMTAPAGVTGAVATPAAAGALECDLAFTMPSLTLDGDPIDENMRVEVRRSGRKVKELTDVVPGAPVSIERLAGRQGMNTYDIVCYNGDGAGMPVSVPVYIGEDKPLPPANVRVTEGKDGCPVVTWDAPAGGVNGGVVNEANLTYTVRRGFDKEYILEKSKDRYVTDRMGMEVVQQAIMYYEVYATNGAGTSEKAESAHFIMGEPYEMPYSESFKDMQEMHGPWLGLLIDNPAGVWYIDEEGARPSCEPYDNNGGLVTFAPGNDPHTSTLATPLVNIDNADHPVLEFYFYCLYGNESRLNIGVRTAETEYEVIRSFVVGDNSFAQGWNRVRLPLAEYQDEGYVQVYFTGINGCVYGNNAIHLDCIAISDIPRYDVAAAMLEVPESIIPAMEATFMATVANVGLEAVNDVTVTLLRGNTPVCTQQVEVVPPSGMLGIGLTDMAELSFDELEEYSFMVSAPSDKNDANDRSAAYDVAVELPHYPVPVVRGRVDGGEAVLEWEKPQTAGVRAPVADGFEDYAPFIIDNVGDWTLTDVDGAAGTTGILDGEGNPLDYDNMGKPMAYQVFNPGMLGFPVYDGDGTRSMYATHGGNQMMCAFCDLDAYNDDWLISPVLPGDAQTISFYAKSYTGYYGLESFVIMVSETGTSISDFVALTEIMSAPKDWTRFKMELPKGTRHFAIRCVSVDQFALCIDDVKFTPESSEPVDLVLTGYNVYRDNALVATAGAEATSCRVAMEEGASPRFRVSAVYHLGESAHSPVVELDMTGINAAGEDMAACSARGYRGGVGIQQPDGSEAVVYSADGRMAATLTGSGSVAIPAGIYIVRFPAGSVKVAVP